MSITNTYDFLSFIKNYKMISNLPIKDQKNIIDKLADLESTDNNNWRIIHFICYCSPPEMIKYIIDKNVNLECETKEGYRPIHFICEFSTPEMIKYIIDKGVELECMNNNKWKPIHLICQYSTQEIIKYIIDKGVKLDVECYSYLNQCKYTPLDLLKLRVNKVPEMVQYIEKHMH